MYCGKCGQQLSEKAKFCPKCGWKVEQTASADGKQEIAGKETEQQGKYDNTRQKPERRKRKKWPWILAGVILIAAAGIAAVFLLHEKQVKEQYDDALADAGRYLEELDYGNAEASYLKAISIDPKKEEPYLKLADLYIADHQPQKALEIVQQGQENVSSANAKEELSGKAEEWKDLEPYTWAVKPEVEADEIYYLQSRDFYAASENERCRQMESDYAVIRQGERYGLIDMAGNLLEGMDCTAVGTILGYYEVTLAEPRYTSEYRTEMSDFYLAESGELEPAVAMFGDMYGSQGKYYYCEGLHNTVDNAAETDPLVAKNWELNELTTAIPVRQTEMTYEEALETGATEMINGELWLDETVAPYAIWCDDELITDFIYDECGSESSGLLAVQQGGKWGYVNQDGEAVIPVEYDASWKHYQGPAEGYQETIVPYCYAAAEGYIPLVKEGVWEMRNAEGSLVIAPGVFEEILPVYEGKCWVKSDGKWGVISLGADAEANVPEEEDTENTAQQESASGDSTVFETLPAEFVFTSGAGGWATELNLEKDGTFHGRYHDSEMGESGENYPNGTTYICNFSGKFSLPEAEGEYEYSMHLEELNVEPGDEYYENGVRYVISDLPYGLEDGEEFKIFMPGISAENLPDNFLMWLQGFTDVTQMETLPYYGIYNVNGGTGFVGGWE